MINKNLLGVQVLPVIFTLQASSRKKTASQSNQAINCLYLKLMSINNH